MISEKELAARFTERGLRPTGQRLLIYRFLLEHRTHPSAYTIYTALVEDHPTLSRTTVYNSLHTMEQAGLIRMIPVDPEEQRFDAELAVHGHFRCRECGEVFDFSLTEAVLQELCPPEFAAESGDVLFRGRCPDCASKSHFTS